MGVMACDRYNCENIMCDKISRKHGYICNGCFDELVAMGPGVNIDSFMESEPKDPMDADSAYMRYASIFQDAYID